MKRPFSEAPPHIEATFTDLLTMSGYVAAADFLIQGNEYMPPRPAMPILDQIAKLEGEGNMAAARSLQATHTFQITQEGNADMLYRRLERLWQQQPSASELAGQSRDASAARSREQEVATLAAKLAAEDADRRTSAFLEQATKAVDRARGGP